MTQWVKALATKIDNLSPIPRTLRTEGENQLVTLYTHIKAIHTCVIM